jgi:hypothetical protein
LGESITQSELLFCYIVVLQVESCSRLRQYAKILKVSGLIPVKDIKFFSSSDLSSRTVALRPTEPLTQMSIRNFPGGKIAAGD